MRIIAGKYRGRRLQAVPGWKTRPTADRIREALFDILGETVRRARVLDLFAGTGALGLEALSRGAARAVLVENDPAARAAIGANIAALGVTAAELLPLDAGFALSRLGEKGEKFDLALADPPYRTREAENLLALIERFAILVRDGVAAIEHAPEVEPLLPGPGWRMLKRKKYGRTVLSFYIYKEDTGKSPEERIPR
jgi:16S rRNA (guanine966-N2)-methyltransferase